MKIAFFDTHRFDKSAFEAANAGLAGRFEIHYFETQLTADTAALAHGFPVLCAFVNDQLNSGVVKELAAKGLKLIALRCAGFNQVDLNACKELGVRVVRVPAYSPNAVAEHALALLLTLNRKIHRAYARVRELNFSLDGLVGFDLAGKTVGILGTGRIGSVFARIAWGLGCHVLAYDPNQNPEIVSRYSVRYVSLAELYRSSDIISLQLPLNKGTRHIINAEAISQMKPGVMLINTGRGALIDTKALVEGLKSKRIGAAGLDVYEEEEGIFFRDLSERGLEDDTLARLLTFPNVIVTAHQAFLTQEALENIAKTTLENILTITAGGSTPNEIALK